MALEARIAGDGLPRFQRALRDLGSTNALRAFSRGLNRTGDRAFTSVRRTLAKQVGLSQAKTVALGGLKRRRANLSNMEFKIESEGEHLSLRDFGARQFGYGVRAKPWGTSRRFAGAFIFAGSPRSGQPVRGGHVFVRTGSASYPIQMLFGPAIPNELVRGETAEAFEKATDALADRIRHELRVLTEGVVT